MSAKSASVSPMYLAIDLGASSGRAVLGTLVGERMETRELRRWTTPLRETQPARAGEGATRETQAALYWDIAAIWDEVRRSLADALAAAPHLRSVSVDSWAVDYVPLDASCAAVRLPHAYRDSRTRGRLDDAARKAGGAEALYAITGIQSLDFNTIAQVMVDVETEPALVARTATRLMIAEYVLYMLSGQQVAERTNASTTQLYDVRRGEWADGVIRAIGDDASRWPTIVEPGTVLGPLRAELLPRGANAPVVIATCAHDTAAAVAAVPADGPAPWAYISSGTWSLVGAELRAPITTPSALRAGFTNEVGLGGTIRFLKNRTGSWVLEECVREWSELGERGVHVSWGTLFALATRAQSMRGVIDLNAAPFGERGGMVAKIQDACGVVGIPQPRSRGAFVRLVLESLADSYRRTLDELDALTGVRSEVVHIVGGGARNALLNQLTADACGRRVIAGPEEATALGNLLVQAHALGDLPSHVSVRDAARASARLTEYTPGRARPNRKPAMSTS